MAQVQVQLLHQQPQLSLGAAVEQQRAKAKQRQQAAVQAASLHAQLTSRLATLRAQRSTLQAGAGTRAADKARLEELAKTLAASAEGLGNAASAAIDVSVNCDLLVDAFAKLAAASAEHCSSAVLGAATLSAKRQPLQEGRDKANASHEAFQHELQGMRDRQSGLAAAVALEAAPAPVDERARKVLEAEVEAIAIARAALKDEKDRVSTLRANHFKEIGKQEEFKRAQAEKAIADQKALQDATTAAHRAEAAATAAASIAEKAQAAADNTKKAVSDEHARSVAARDERLGCAAAAAQRKTAAQEGLRLAQASLAASEMLEARLVRKKDEAKRAFDLHSKLSADAQASASSVAGKRLQLSAAASDLSKQRGRCAMLRALIEAQQATDADALQLAKAVREDVGGALKAAVDVMDGSGDFLANTLNVWAVADSHAHFSADAITAALADANLAARAAYYENAEAADLVPLKCFVEGGDLREHFASLDSVNKAAQQAAVVAGRQEKVVGASTLDICKLGERCGFAGKASTDLSKAKTREIEKLKAEVQESLRNAATLDIEQGLRSKLQAKTAELDSVVAAGRAKGAELAEQLEKQRSEALRLSIEIVAAKAAKESRAATAKARASSAAAAAAAAAASAAALSGTATPAAGRGGAPPGGAGPPSTLVQVRHLVQSGPSPPTDLDDGGFGCGKGLGTTLHTASAKSILKPASGAGSQMREAEEAEADTAAAQVQAEAESEAAEESGRRRGQKERRVEFADASVADLGADRSIFASMHFDADAAPLHSSSPAGGGGTDRKGKSKGKDAAGDKGRGDHDSQPSRSLSLQLLPPPQWQPRLQARVPASDSALHPHLPGPPPTERTPAPHGASSSSSGGIGGGRSSTSTSAAAAGRGSASTAAAKVVKAPAVAPLSGKAASRLSDVFRDADW